MSKDNVAFPYQKKYSEKQKQQGQRRVGLWVPLDRVEELKAVARRMREEASGETAAA